LQKHSVKIAGHATSITLEDEFWNALKEEASKQGTSVSALIAEIDENREGNLSSAIRVYVLKRLQHGHS
jgi:predicted DNA-binding ribbon-helix-helix protein